jgi:hypothetical protein
LLGAQAKFLSLFGDKQQLTHKTHRPKYIIFSKSVRSQHLWYFFSLILIQRVSQSEKESPAADIAFASLLLFIRRQTAISCIYHVSFVERLLSAVAF